jgi:hydrogenase-4 component H
MTMLKTVLGNFMRPARTRKPDDMPSVPPAFRGIIEHDAARCTGCGTCAYVCSPKAITLEERGETAVAWRFFAGQCSFCGLCAAYCPTQAIATVSRVPGVAGNPADHRWESLMPLEPCPRCGTPHIPLPEATLAEIPLSDKKLCAECRRQAASRRIRDAFLGTEDKTHAAR